MTIVRTLRREYQIAMPDRETARSLAFMEIAPEIVGVELEPVRLRVEREYGFLSLMLPSGKRVAGTAIHLITKLHSLIMADVLRTEPGAAFLHCSTIVGPRGRAALIGAKGTGKTTLALKLAAAGHLVEGDEHLVIGEDVVARPRTMRVKQGSLLALPEWANDISRLPFIENWDGGRIYSVNPTIFGTPWRIARGALDRLIFIEANHGGRSVIRPVSPDDAFRQLLPHVMMPSHGIAKAASRLRQLCHTLPAYRLALGDLAGAQHHLENHAVWP